VKKQPDEVKWPTVEQDIENIKELYQAGDITEYDKDYMIELSKKAQL